MCHQPPILAKSHTTFTANFAKGFEAFVVLGMYRASLDKLFEKKREAFF